MSAGDRAWLIIGAGVLVYELLAPDGELLSEAVDRYRRHHPIITDTLIVYIAAHLLRGLPARFDPLAHIARLGGR